ncbi:hypothetical protein [Chryseobacterium sp. 2R14A]|uniref:hypothetical protein n=1 Tax=Chryseobacterium sp. 2R14A TaxID=3380353 RepID=UPI003CF08704
MKKKLFTLIIAELFLFSCTSHKPIKNIGLNPFGEYNREFENHLIHSLTIKEDSTFIYSIKGGEVFNSESKCNGKWQIIANELILNCNKEDLLNQLSSGYLSPRNYKIKFISSEKIYIINEDITLDRK